MELDIFKPKAPPLFGLDISSSSVKMIEIVDAGKGAYRVERYAIEPLPREAVVDGNINNLEAVAESVKRAHKRLATRTKHVAMAVPSGAVITKKIIVQAGLREDELELQVETEANQYIPFALDEVNLDFQLVGPAPSNPEEEEVLIAATRKEKVEDRVARYAIEPLPREAVVDGNINNLEAVAESVKRAHKRLATRTKHVAMAVPSGAVITKKIIVQAGLREDELELQVETEANQYIPFALDEVNLDFQLVGPAPSNPEEEEVLIAATRKEKVEDRVAVAESAGLKALVMDVESYAQQSALSLVTEQLPNGGKDQNIAVVDIGANVMNVTVLRNDQSVYTREQAFGGNQLTQDIVSRYGMSVEEAENAKRSGGLPDDFESEVLRPFMDNLSMEVQRALQFFFTSTQYNAVDQILLAGGSAVIAGLDEAVNTRTQVPTMVANPFAAMQTSPRIQLKRLMVDAPSMIVACGLAMRRFDPL